MYNPFSGDKTLYSKYQDNSSIDPEFPIVIAENGGEAVAKLLNISYGGGPTFIFHPDREYVRLDGYSESILTTAIDETLSDDCNNGSALNSYTLIVNNGSGSGTYDEGTSCSITAKDSSGYEFDSWTGNIEVLTSTTSKTTYVTMPDSDIEITATYKKEITTDLMKLDQKHIISAISASQYGDTWSSDKSIDGDNETFWHNETGTVPAAIDYVLDNPYELTGFSTMIRQDNGDSWIESYKLEVSSDSINWTTASEGSLSNSSSEHIIEFGYPTKQVKFVRLTALSSGSANGKIAIAEFNLFYKEEVSLFQKMNRVNSETITSVANGVKLSGFSTGSYNISLYTLNGRELYSDRVYLSETVEFMELHSLSKGIVIMRIEGSSFKHIAKIKF